MSSNSYHFDLSRSKINKTTLFIKDISQNRSVFEIFRVQCIFGLFLKKLLIVKLQIYGRLPFDDSDHKKLIKQAVTGVIFPLKPEVSEKCRNLINKLLCKASDRIPMRFIKSDSWFRKQKTLADEKARQTSSEEMETIISDTPILPDSSEPDQSVKIPSKVLSVEKKEEIEDAPKELADGQDDQHVTS